MSRGRHKIFLGMAAGVGKTYRMLQEGHAEADGGRDVVVGYLEPHEREETAAQARGLEVVPRRRVAVRDVGAREMDLPALLARAPELALIDELAHTNPAGLEHGKRYEDIADVLAAGIDVFSTVNVQHLESLNDQVAELTGVRVRETVPDSVLGRGRRGGADRPHPGGADRPAAGGQGLPGRRTSTRRSTTSSRSRTWRRCARSACGRSPRTSSPSGSTTATPSRSARAAAERVVPDAPKAVGERVLALVRPQPSAQRLVRRAWRSAQRLGTELDLLWVKPPGLAIEGECERQVTALRQLASVLGAHLLIEEHDDLVAATARVVRERGSTYLMVGESEPPRAAWRACASRCRSG